MNLKHYVLYSTYVPVDVISVIVIIVFVFAVAMHGRQVEWMER